MHEKCFLPFKNIKLQNMKVKDYLQSVLRIDSAHNKGRLPNIHIFSPLIQSHT